MIARLYAGPRDGQEFRCPDPPPPRISVPLEGRETDWRMDRPIEEQTMLVGDYTLAAVGMDGAYYRWSGWRT